MRSYQYLTAYDQDDHHVEVAERRLRELIDILLVYVPVDEVWYRAVNRDVGDAIKAGKFSSAANHYATAGYFEDRFPRPIFVDEPWYLKTYTDVAGAVERGLISSAQAHFDQQGFREGRIPSPGWSLLAEGPLFTLLTSSQSSRPNSTADELVTPVAPAPKSDIDGRNKSPND